MQMHASCAARHGQGVLVLGPAGSGKSSLILSLVRAGFMLVADDQVVVTDGIARCTAPLAGLLEVRGAGITRMPYLRFTPLRIVVDLGIAERLPQPGQHSATGLPLFRMGRETAPDYLMAALWALPQLTH